MCIHYCARGHWFLSLPCAYDLGTRSDYKQRFPDAEESWEDYMLRWRMEQIEAEAVHFAICREMPARKGVPRMETWGFHRFPSRPGRQATLC